MWQCCAVKAPGDSGRWHYSPLASDDPGVILCSLTSHISHQCWLYVVHCSHLVTCHSHSSLSPACLLTQYPGQTALPSLLFSAPAQLSRLPGQAVVCPAHSRPGRNSQWNSPAGAWVSQDSEIFPGLKAYPTFELKYLTFEIFLYHLEHPEMQWRRVMKLCEWAYLKCLWNVYLKCLSNLYSLK